MFFKLGISIGSSLLIAISLYIDGWATLAQKTRWLGNWTWPTHQCTYIIPNTCSSWIETCKGELWGKRINKSKVLLVFYFLKMTQLFTTGDRRISLAKKIWDYHQLFTTVDKIWTQLDFDNKFNYNHRQPGWNLTRC